MILLMKGRVDIIAGSRLFFSFSKGGLITVIFKAFGKLPDWRELLRLVPGSQKSEISW